MAGPNLWLKEELRPVFWGSIRNNCPSALGLLGFQELACGLAGYPPLLAGFQGPDLAGHGLCLSPRPCQPL